MNCNMGAFDGAARTGSLVIAIIYVIALGGHWAWLIPTAGLFVTAVLMWCPIYAMLGISTNPKGSGQ